MSPDQEDELDLGKKQKAPTEDSSDAKTTKAPGKTKAKAVSFCQFEVVFSGLKVIKKVKSPSWKVIENPVCFLCLKINHCI